MAIPGTNAIIDISAYQGKADFTAIKAAGIAGVIHKATEGVGYQDPVYAHNMAAAKAAGLLWGAFHFGTGSDPKHQAADFIQAASAGADDLLILDFEGNEHGTQMTVDQARIFVREVYNATGRWPGFYSGRTIKEALKGSVDPILGKCWLWVAQYAPTASTQATWPKWTMWQYSDGQHGPGASAVAGIHCDRDTFNGNLADFFTFWQSGGTKPPTYVV